MIKTLLELPRRVSGIKNPSKNKLRKLSDIFPLSLDVVEEFAPDKVGNIDHDENQYCIDCNLDL